MEIIPNWFHYLILAIKFYSTLLLSRLSLYSCMDDDVLRWIVWYINLRKFIWYTFLWYHKTMNIVSFKIDIATIIIECWFVKNNKLWSSMKWWNTLVKDADYNQSFDQKIQFSCVYLSIILSVILLDAG